MNRLTIKKAADLDAIFGKKLAKAIKGLRGQTYRRIPSAVTLTETKPQFHLDDSATLKAFVLDLAKGEIVASHYCGSYDTILHHKEEQLGEGQKASEGMAVCFLETYYNGRNTSWELTVVSSNLTKQIA